MGKYSASLNKRIRTRGPSEGFCVICGCYGKLSRDHVPPKKCNNLNDTEIKALFTNQDSARVGITSQGGTHFKTLCEKCNSERLGLGYDPSLIDLSNEITSLVLGAKNRRVILPKAIFPRIKPERIARAVIGHTLAAVAVDEVTTGIVPYPMNDALRGYFLDESMSLPEKVEIFYWPYPWREQVVVKGMAKAQLNTKGFLLGHVLKFLPLGFWVVWDRPGNISVNLPSLINARNVGLDREEQVEVNLEDIPPKRFPEETEGMEINLLNDNQAYVSIPK